jgi:hypothetical protein
VNGDALAALLAAGGATAVAGGVVLHEQHREHAMRAGRRPLELRFPAGLKADAVESLLGGLVGLGADAELVFEVRATAEAISHQVWVSPSATRAVGVALRAAVSTLRVSEGATDLRAGATITETIDFSADAALRTDESEQAAAALLGHLVGLGPDELVIVRWALRPSSAPTLPTPDNERKRRQAREWQAKLKRPGFRVRGLILVAASERARAVDLGDQLGTVLRARSTQAAHLRVRRTAPRSLSSMPRTTWRSPWLSTSELLGLLGWPISNQSVPGLVVGAARELPVPSNLDRAGRPLLIGRDARGVERPVALGPRAALLHTAISGPTGSGKSSLLATGIVSDIAAGHGGVVIDPKSDLLSDVLERIPPEHADRVVVLDPAASGPMVGLDLMASGDPDLRADVLIGALSSIFAGTWGQRSDYYGRLALRTLADVPGATLADFGRLFFEPAFRRRALASLSDPWLAGAWQSYEALSPGEQAQHVQAPMAKVMGLIARPAVRRVLAQPAPKLDVARLLAERKWLFVNLAPGTLGEPAARLLGAVVVYVVWSAIEARAAIPKEQRHPLFVYVDELATLADLPFGFELLAERARGLGGGLVIALQTFSRLPEPVRAAVFGNVATLLTFRASYDEATRIARELPGLSADDLQALSEFEVAARVATGDRGTSVAVVTGHTEPPLPLTGQSGRIREASAARYGVDPAEIDAALVGRLEHAEDLGDIGRTRRGA